MNSMLRRLHDLVSKAIAFLKRRPGKAKRIRNRSGYCYSAEYKREKRRQSLLRRGLMPRPFGTFGRRPMFGPFLPKPIREPRRFRPLPVFEKIMIVQRPVQYSVMSHYWREKKAQRKALVARQCDGTLDAVYIARLIRRAVLCAYCNVTMTKRVKRSRLLCTDATLDHVIPLSKGGAHGAENVVVACHSCNSGKRDRIIVPDARCAAVHA
jgi:5-methylcytosine-specific restriction endonuclease McrA